MVRLDDQTLRVVIEWQRMTGDAEVCGFCALDAQGEQHLIRVTNNDVLPGAFAVSSSEDNVARLAAAERGWKIVAFWHTHPDDSPEMSARDARSFAHDNVPWIIIGTPTTDPQQRTYILGIEPVEQF